MKMKILKWGTWILALCCLAAAGVDVFRALNPTLFRRRYEWLAWVPATWLTVALAVCTIVASIVAYAIARHQTTTGLVRTHTAWASGIAILSTIAAVVAMFITINYPLGLFGVEIHKAPLQRRETAEETISSVVGECKNGWVELGQIDVQGITFGIVCPTTDTAYVEFEDPIEATKYKGIIRDAGPALMKNYASATWSEHPTKYDALTGQLWVAITTTDQAPLLQAVIGGQLQPLN